MVGDFTTPFLVKGSADGSTWQRLDIGPIDGTLADIAEGAQGTVLVQVTSDPNTGDQATALWHSGDGTSFQPVDDQADLGKASVSSVFAGPTGFAAVGQIMSSSDEDTNRIWTSADGISWKSAVAPADGQIDQIVLTDLGYIGFDTGLYGSVPAEYASIDGLTWSRGADGTQGPFGQSDTVLSTPVVVGNTVAIVRNDGTVWTGSINAGDAGPTIAWRHLTEIDPSFAGAQVLSAAVSASGATMLGFDRTTLLPVIWRSADGSTWRRDAVDASTFGGGAATLLARSGEVDATLGFEGQLGRLHGASALDVIDERMGPLGRRHLRGDAGRRDRTVSCHPADRSGQAGGNPGTASADVFRARNAASDGIRRVVRVRRYQLDRCASALADQTTEALRRCTSVGSGRTTHSSPTACRSGSHPAPGFRTCHSREPSPLPAISTIRPPPIAASSRPLAHRTT
jgi:hypothetical protein